MFIPFLKRVGLTSIASGCFHPTASIFTVVLRLRRRAQGRGGFSCAASSSGASTETTTTTISRTTTCRASGTSARRLPPPTDAAPGLWRQDHGPRSGSTPTCSSCASERAVTASAESATTTVSIESASLPRSNRPISRTVRCS